MTAAKYGWTLEAALIDTHNWVSLKTYRMALKSITFKNIGVQANRDAVLQVLDGLGSPVTPFDVSKRFPDNEIWVDLDHPYINTHFRTIVAACSYKDRQNEKNREVSTPIPSVENKLFSNLNDAIVAFGHAVSQLRQAHIGYAVEDQHIFGIYTQTSFEQQTGLIWNPAK
uniref:Capsid protein n=1 Tax=Myzus persicae nege-like virus 1 TaxID=2961857 RepID=A0A976X8Z3_9VIRU|nr:hypothetical protein 3 [Myzus persicae nege-like virus 1]